MPKKRKLNSKNPKYWPQEKTVEPKVKERRLLKTRNPKIKVYSVFLEN